MTENKKRGFASVYPDAKEEFDKLNADRRRRRTELRNNQNNNLNKENNYVDTNNKDKVTNNTRRSNKNTRQNNNKNKNKSEKGFLFGTIENNLSELFNPQKVLVYLVLIILGTFVPILIGSIIAVLTELKVGFGFAIFLHILTIAGLTQGVRIDFVSDRLDSRKDIEEDIAYVEFYSLLFKVLITDILLYSVMYLPIILTIYINFNTIENAFLK